MTRPWIYRTAPGLILFSSIDAFLPEFYQNINFTSSYKSSLFPALMLIKHNRDSENQQLVKVKCDDYLLLLKEGAMPIQLPHTSPSMPVWLSCIIQRTSEDTHYDIDSSFMENKQWLQAKPRTLESKAESIWIKRFMQLYPTATLTEVDIRFWVSSPLSKEISDFSP